MRAASPPGRDGLRRRRRRRKTTGRIRSCQLGLHESGCGKVLLAVAPVLVFPQLFIGVLGARAMVWRSGLFGTGGSNREEKRRGRRGRRRVLHGGRSGNGCGCKWRRCGRLYLAVSLVRVSRHDRLLRLHYSTNVLIGQVRCPVGGCQFSKLVHMEPRHGGP
jgi:hypothetical protein